MFDAVGGAALAAFAAQGKTAMAAGEYQNALEVSKCSDGSFVCADVRCWWAGLLCSY